MTTAKQATDGALRGKGCLGRCAPDEPVFVLRAQDRCAAATVRQWAAAAQHVGAPREKVVQALDDADAMDAWREAHGGGKVPD
mgnify:FL=1